MLRQWHFTSVFEDEPEPGDATAEAVLNRNEKIKNSWSPYEDQKLLVHKVHKFWSVLKKKLISDPDARDRARVDFRLFFSRNRRSKIFTTLLKEVYEDMIYVLKVKSTWPGTNGRLGIGTDRPQLVRNFWNSFGSGPDIDTPRFRKFLWSSPRCLIFRS